MSKRQQHKIKQQIMKHFLLILFINHRVIHNAFASTWKFIKHETHPSCSVKRINRADTAVSQRHSILSITNSGANIQRARGSWTPSSSRFGRLLQNLKIYYATVCRRPGFTCRQLVRSAPATML